MAIAVLIHAVLLVVLFRLATRPKTIVQMSAEQWYDDTLRRLINGAAANPKRMQFYLDRIQDAKEAKRAIERLQEIEEE